MLAAIKRPEDGAVAIFDGIVRNNSRGRPHALPGILRLRVAWLWPRWKSWRARRWPLCHSRCAHDPSPGTVTDRRKQRLYCGCVGASGRGLRRLPLAHRYAEEDGAHLEEGVLRRRRDLGRWRAFSGRDSAGRTTITSGFGRQQRAAFNPTRQIVRNGVYTNECPLTPRILRAIGVLALICLLALRLRPGAEQRAASSFEVSPAAALRAEPAIHQPGRSAHHDIQGKRKAGERLRHRYRRRRHAGLRRSSRKTSRYSRTASRSRSRSFIANRSCRSPSSSPSTPASARAAI